MKTLKRHKRYLVLLVALWFLSACSIQTKIYQDDVYYDPSTDSVATSQHIVAQSSKNVQEQANGEGYENNNYKDSSSENYYYEDSDSIAPKSYSESYQDEGGNTYITNNYYDDYYDYSYSARIRRFDDDWDFPYYSSYYTSRYWYSYDPWDWDFSIYLGYPWWGIGYYYGYRPFYHYRPYYWGSYWSGYDWGYYDGYYDGYWDGYYAGNYDYYTPYYYNSYDQTITSVHRRGGIGSLSPASNQHGTYQSFVDTYQRMSASKPLDSNTPTVSKPIGTKPTLLDNHATTGTQIQEKPSKLEKPQSSLSVQKKPGRVSGNGQFLQSSERISSKPQRISEDKPASSSLQTQEKPSRLEKPQNSTSIQKQPARVSGSRQTVTKPVRSQTTNQRINTEKPERLQLKPTKVNSVSGRKAIHKPANARKVRNYNRREVNTKYSRPVRRGNIKNDRSRYQRPSRDRYQRPTRVKERPSSAYRRSIRSRTIKYQRPQRTSGYKQYSRPSNRSNRSSSYYRSSRSSYRSSGSSFSSPSVGSSSSGRSSSGGRSGSSSGFGGHRR